MQTMRESWTDKRLDDLNDRVSEGFRRVDGEIRDLRQEMNDRFDRVDNRFDSIQRLIAYGAVTLSGSFVAGFVVLATQL